MKEKLEKLNKALKPYHALLSMIVFFVTIFVGAYKFIITPSDLKVTILDESISYPASISNSVARLYQATDKKDSLQVPAATIYSFLVNTTTHKKLTLKNGSEKMIKGVKFKYLNVEQLTAWGIAAGYMTTAENAALIRSLQYDDGRKIVILASNLDLPAKSEVVIDLWGSFKDQMFNDDLIATYDEGDAYVATTYTVDGLKGYILNYYFEIMIFVLLIFSVCYMVGIQQLKKKYAVQTTAGEPD